MPVLQKSIGALNNNEIKCYTAGDWEEKDNNLVKDFQTCQAIHLVQVWQKFILRTHSYNHGSYKNF